MRMLGAKIEAVITRLLGVLLAALAMQFVIDGVKASFGAGLRRRGTDRLAGAVVAIRHSRSGDFAGSGTGSSQSGTLPCAPAGRRSRSGCARDRSSISAMFGQTSSIRRAMCAARSRGTRSGVPVKAWCTSRIASPLR